MKDVTAAAEAAYKLAAHAAAAARAALKLSQSQFHNKGPDDHSSSINQQRSVSDLEKSLKSIVQVDGNTGSKETNHWTKGFIKSEQGITEANIEKTLSSFSVEEVLDETGVEFIFQCPKGILLKSQVDPIVYFGEGSSRLESTHHRSTAKELDLNRSNRGRKPVSMRTRRVDGR
ncbi:hypothetical protein L1049_002529 [Liquidambar formosana]|uniref:Uncharacterized protein n=1 Tax=Liquidambar formosana TaxID=63359 RepID=A0AAP0R8Y7_LIQFO